MNPAAQPCWVLGTGFLGSRLLARLPQGIGVDAVAAADVQGDAADPGVLAQAAARQHPALVFCCLSTRGGGADAYRHTYLDVVEALPTACKIVFCSALSAGQGLSEKAAILRRAEVAVVARGGVVVRMAALYGEGRCELLRRHMAREAQLPGPPQRRLNYLHADDAAAAMLAAAAAPAGIYAACGDSMTKAEAYALLERLTGIPASAEVSTSAGSRGISDVTPSAVAPAVPGWEPRITFAEWCRSHA